jgi:hypothetical protein
VPFTFILDDPTGNSFIESAFAPPPPPLTPPAASPKAATPNSTQNFSTAPSRRTSPLGWRSRRRTTTSTSRRTSNVPPPLRPKCAGIADKGKVGAIAVSAKVMASMLRSFNVSRAEDIVTLPAPCSACGRDGEVRMVNTGGQEGGGADLKKRSRTSRRFWSWRSRANFAAFARRRSSRAGE